MRSPIALASAYPVHLRAPPSRSARTKSHDAVMLHSATNEYMRPSREYHTCSGAMARINAASTATRLPATAQPSPSIAPTAAMPAMAETQRP